MYYASMLTLLSLWMVPSLLYTQAARTLFPGLVDSSGGGSGGGGGGDDVNCEAPSMFAEAFEGLMTYAPDGKPVVGPHPLHPGTYTRYTCTNSALRVHPLDPTALRHILALP